MTSSSDNRILVGVIGAPHGVRGEVRLRSYTADPVAVGRYRPLLGADGRSVVLRGARPLKGDLVIVSVEGVSSREAAAALTGTALYVERSALPAPVDDEFYHADLIGMEAVDAAGAFLGRVSAVLNYGAGDILEVTPEGRPAVLVAFTRAFVPAVDVAARRVTIAAGALAGDEG